MAATISEQFEHNENPARAGFLLSGDPTGVFANVLRHSTPVRSPLRRNLNPCEIYFYNLKPGNLHDGP